MTDDLKMQALDGDYETRVRRSFEAGCDIALCCNFSLEDKVAAQKTARPLEGAASIRANRALASLSEPQRQSTQDHYARLAQLLKPVIV